MSPLLLLLLAAPVLPGELPAAFVEAITVETAAEEEPAGARRASAAEVARWPDANAAEAAARLPGVVAEGELGEVDRVLLRGAEPRLVATTLDGERLPSPDGEARSAGLSLIPAALLEAVAVSTTLSADRDADAVGGTVDLLTRRVPQGGLRSVALERGADLPSRDALYGGELAWARRLLGDRLGVLAAASGESGGQRVDARAARWGDDGLERDELLDHALERDRLGGLLGLDFAPSETASVKIQGLYSRTDTHELRRRVKDDFAEGLVERELKDAARSRDLLATTARGNRLAGLSLLTLAAGYNRAGEREPDRVDTSFVYEGLDEDPSGFLLDKIGVERNANRERNLFAALDLARPLARSGRASAVLELGAKVRQKDRRRDLRLTLFRPAEPIRLADWAADAAGGSRLGPMIDPDTARRLLASLGLDGEPGLAEEAADYRANERTAAAYAQVELERGPLTLLPGLRYERTSSDYRGFELSAGGEGDGGLRPLRGERAEGHLLPMLHAALALRSGLELRAALTRGYARPDYFDLVPYRVVDTDDREIEAGNPDLRATRSWNADARLDRRWGATAAAGAGLFYRELTDFVFVRRGEVELDGAIWDSTRPENGARARLWGAELAARWQAPAAAGPWAGWGLEVSATLTRSAAWTRDGAERLPLPGQAPWAGSAALTYRRGGLAGALGLGWTDAYLAELGAARGEDLYRDVQRRLDLALSYAFASGLEWRFEARDLTDEPSRMYAGSPERRTFLERGGRSLGSGFSFRF
ncbi:MAG TPA: TonB-dependent receptor [Thermoanaerobaculia bacterium]|nr:TonB-dependent receptor [Thermoanaerobaculia bacterium]